MQDTLRHSGSAAQRALGPVAIAAIAAAAGFAAIGTFAEASDSDMKDFVAVLVIIAIGAAVVFGFVVPRGLGREAAGVSALVLSVLGLLLVAVFWSGLPPILAAGGILLGWAGWDSPRGRGLCRAAVVIGTIALAADVAIVVADWLSNR